jgi:peptidoglycan/LPS O-acetylase OafA/YrhL
MRHALTRYFPGVPQEFIPAVIMGQTSVTFFYMLSGYILAVVYLRRSGGAVEWKPFYAARFARIYPLFTATIFFALPLLPWLRIPNYGAVRGSLLSLVTLTGNLLMLKGWVPYLRGLDDPNWSLSVEAFFYLLFPVLGPFIWRQSRQRALVLFLAFYFFWEAIVFWVYSHFTFNPYEFIKWNPIVYLNEFICGIILARILEGHGAGDWVARFGKKASMPIFALASVAFFVIVYRGVFVEAGGVMDGLSIPIFALIIWSCSYSDTFLSRILSVRWLVVLGEASYGLYLIHLPVYEYFARLNLIRPYLFPLYLATTIGLSVLSFYFFEIPARRVILHRFGVRPREGVQESSAAQ